jgi:RHS repeat-associated protein
VGGSWARTGLPAAVASATYNAANHQTAFGGQTLTYDLNGNLTGDGTNTYTWNARHQLASISGPLPASFVYDPFGRRQRKTVDGVITDVVYDGLNPVRQAVGTDTVDLLTGLGIDEYLTRTDASSTRDLLSDALGTTVALGDSSGTAQTEYSYEPFGATTASGTASGNELRYTGREDDGTGVYYYRARYYHPQLQRFISEDPIEFAGGDTNLYAYVGNNPLSESDPYGLFGIEDLPTIPQPVVDAVAGFGDSLSFSGTRAFRDLTGINDQVDQCSRSYAGGESASFAVGFARIGYAGAAKALPLIVRSGSTQLERALAVSAARATR